MTNSLLVVDDNEFNRDMLSRRLRRHGYAVEAASNGHEALGTIGAGGVDLVLLDIEMPGMSGLDVLQRIREARSAADLPVIMVSARQDSDTVVAALGMGANDYITKPVDFAVARARIDAQLTRIRQESVNRRSDPLTRLSNRSAVAEWWQRRPAAGSCRWIVVLDVDRFRTINNGLGRRAGDRLLLEIAGRLQATIPADALLARTDADEFVCLLEGAAEGCVAELAARMLDAMSGPFDIAGQEVTATASIGIAVDTEGRSEDEVFGEADAALYRAKLVSGNRWERYVPAMHTRARARLEIETELQRALASETLSVDYQPIIAIPTRSIIGFEALARWRHPQRGDIPPAEFIPIAEETGLIVPLGSFVLRRSCEQLKAWQRRRPSATMAVNVSGRQLLHPDFVDEIRTVLGRTNLAPHTLRLEVTESTLVENTEQVQLVLGRLRGLGVGLSLDDFGTGYSSLSYLQHFAMSTLKIDRAFVRDLASSGRRDLVRAIIEVGRSLGMDVIAEGVESETEMAELRSLGCDYGQGFLFARPLNPADAGRALSSPAEEASADVDLRAFTI